VVRYECGWVVEKSWVSVCREKLIGVVVRWKKELAFKATVRAQDASEEGATAA
jgi:hypothetical protein